MQLVRHVAAPLVVHMSSYERGVAIRVFSKCTRMAIMPILASEALFRENCFENKKNQLQNATLVSNESLDL